MTEVALVIGGLNRLLDAVFRIDSHTALNDGIAESPGDGQTSPRGIAGDIQRALSMLKVEAYDEATQRVAYARVRVSDAYRALRQCTARLNKFDLATLNGRDERLAFWINLYNALVVDAVIAFDVRDSVTKDLGFFRRAAYCIGGMRFSADDIEHGILRDNRHHPLFPFPQFATDDPRRAFSILPLDPRVHAALNCASRSCPPIAVYAAEQLDQQLDLAMRSFVIGGAQIDLDHGVARISQIFRWYAADFGGRDGVLDWIFRGLSNEASRKWLEANLAKVRIEYSRYDWSLNGQTSDR